MLSLNNISFVISDHNVTTVSPKLSKLHILNLIDKKGRKGGKSKEWN